jgi:hypothetical protein
LIKTDSSGNLEWSKDFSQIGPAYGLSACQSSDGSFAMTGFFHTGASYDIFFIKLDSSSNTISSKIIAPSSFDEKAYSILSSPDLGFIIAGYTTDMINDLNFSLIKTDTMGVTRCNDITAMPADSIPATIDSNIATTTTNLTLTAGIASTVTGSGGTEIPLCATTGIESGKGNSQFEMNVYPNPTRENFSVTFSTVISGVIELFNITGEKIYENIIENEKAVDIKRVNIPQGIYQVKFHNVREQSDTKIIILD